MHRRMITLVSLPFLWTLAACGGVDDLTATVATLEPARGEVKIGDDEARPVSRVAEGQEIQVGEDGLARLGLDGGPVLVLGAGAKATVMGISAIRIEAGRVFVEVEAGDLIEITTPKGVLRAGDASFSIAIAGEAVSTYVVRGEVGYTADSARGLARAGERLTLGGAEPAIAAATLWEDWTGGFARPGPVDERNPEGMGTLEARVPDEIGQARWPLVVRRLDVRVRIVDDLAMTEVDQIFFNPASETVEGLYRVALPENAVLQRFAVDRNGRMVDGYVREQAQARQAYEAQVYRGSTLDPALLEWDAPGAYRARIYPIGAGETRRIVIRYAEWLHRTDEDAPRLYRYPMAGGARAPHIQEFALTADLTAASVEGVRAGMGAEVEGNTVQLRRSDFRPRADFWMELLDEDGGDTLRAWRADHQPPQRDPNARAITNEADERDYWYLPVVLPARLATENRPEGIDLVIVADVSAATDRSHLELGRSMVESLVSHLGESDRVAVVTSDLTIRAVGGEETPALGPASAARMHALLDGLARVPAGGATDIGAALSAAAALLDPTRAGAVIYVGDGAPTVGELGADGLIEQLLRLPSPTRLYAVAVGADANLDLLEAVTRGGGLALRIEERASAADAAVRVIAHAHRPLAQRVTVDVGTGIDNVFPRRPVDTVVGDVLAVVGRIRGDVPDEVTVRGTIYGREFEEKLAVVTGRTEGANDLRLRWAGERLRHLLLEGASREEVAELGTRYGLITPFTSYYVPSAAELSDLGERAAPLLDQPPLPLGEPASSSPRLAGLLGHATPGMALLGALALPACGFDLGSEAEPAPASTPVSASADEAEQVPDMLESDDEGGRGKRARGEEGQMGREERRTNNRYGIEGPTDDEDPSMARQQAQPTTTALPQQPGAPSAEPEPSAAEAPARARAMPDSDMAAAPGPMGVTAAGRDPSDALGALEGDEIGENFGFGGQGLAGTGRGGGGEGDGTIGLGNLGTIGHGGGGGTGSGYGRGAGGFSGRDAFLPRVRSGSATVRGSLSREVIRRVIQRHINEVRFCYEQQLNQNPELSGRVSVEFVISPSGAVQSSAIQQSTLGSSPVESCISSAVRRWAFPAPDGGGIVMVTYPFMLDATRDGGGGGGGGGGGADTYVTVVSITHRPSQCSDAAGLLPDDRRALWRERLRNAGGVAGWVEVYQEAVRRCEARSWRDRRSLLSIVLEQAGSIQNMITLYRYLGDSGARTWIRAAILRRVRTPEDLRLVRESMGLASGVDAEMINTMIDRATTPAARIRVVRQLVQQYPQSFDLKLRLLEELERAGKAPEARRLAWELRADPLADAGVRTAIGEMFARMGDTEEARRVFSEIVEFAPFDDLARRRLGDLYRAYGWYDDAYRQYVTLSEIRPDDPSVFLLMAQAAAGAGRVDEALRLEQRLAETAEPGFAEGVARTAILWSSVRFAKLRAAAREANDTEQLEGLLARMRRSGVLREAGAMRVSLTWSHPDAQLSLWVAHPGLGLSRPPDIYPEFGLEALGVAEEESGRYTFEVRRNPLGRNREHLARLDAELVVVWNEGQADEKTEVVPLRFEGDRIAFAWSMQGRELTVTQPSAEARGEVRR